MNYVMLRAKMSEEDQHHTTQHDHDQKINTKRDIHTMKQVRTDHQNIRQIFTLTIWYQSTALTHRCTIKNSLSMASLSIASSASILHLFNCILAITSPTSLTSSVTSSLILSHTVCHLSTRSHSCIISCIICNIISRNITSTTTRTSHHHPLFSSLHVIMCMRHEYSVSNH